MDVSTKSLTVATAAVGLAALIPFAKPIHKYTLDWSTTILLRRKIFGSRRGVMKALERKTLVCSKATQVVYRAFLAAYSLPWGSMLIVKASYGTGKSHALMALACGDLPLIPDCVAFFDFNVNFDGPGESDNAKTRWLDTILQGVLGLPSDMDAGTAAKALVEAVAHTNVANGTISWIQNGLLRKLPKQIALKGREKLLAATGCNLSTVTDMGCCSGLILIDAVNYPAEELLGNSPLREFFHGLMHEGYKADVITFVSTNDTRIANELSNLNGQQKSSPCEGTFSESPRAQILWNDFGWDKEDLQDHLGMKFGYDENAIEGAEDVKCPRGAEKKYSRLFRSRA